MLTIMWSNLFFMDLLQHRCNSLVRNSKRILSRYIKQKGEKDSGPRLTNKQKEKGARGPGFLEFGKQHAEFEIAPSRAKGQENVWEWGGPVCSTRLRWLRNDSNDYIVSFKMDRAKLLLSDDVCCPIAEVAYRLGYSDPIYFSRTFKKHGGYHPCSTEKNMLVSQKEEVS